MRHSQVLRRLSAHLERELAPPERARVEAHLEACESCRREARALERTVDLLRDLPDPSPPEGLAGSVIERLRAGEGQASRLAVLRDGFSRWLAGLRDGFSRWLAGLRDGISRWLAAPLSAPLSAVAVGLLGLLLLRPELLPEPFRLRGPEPVASRVEAPAFAPTNRLPGAFVDRTLPAPLVAPRRAALRPRALGAAAEPEEIPPQPGGVSETLETVLTNPQLYLDTLTGLTADDRDRALARLVEHAVRSGRTDELLRVIDGTEHAIAPLVVGRLTSAR